MALDHVVKATLPPGRRLKGDPRRQNSPYNSRRINDVLALAPGAGHRVRRDVIRCRAGCSSSVLDECVTNGTCTVVAKSTPMSMVSRSVNRSPMLDSGVSCNLENYGMQSWNADPSSNQKSIAQDVDENAASSSQVRHQNEQRSSIE